MYRHPCSIREISWQPYLMRAAADDSFQTKIFVEFVRWSSLMIIIGKLVKPVFIEEKHIKDVLSTNPQ